MLRLSGKTVLIADDDLLFREVLRDLFEAEGARILEAAGGVQALQLALSNPVDAVISDLNMPEGGGLDFLRGFRAARFSEPFVLLLTNSLEVKRADALEQGADLVFSKPFEFNDLMESLLRALQC